MIELNKKQYNNIGLFLKFYYEQLNNLSLILNPKYLVVSYAMENIQQ